MFDATEVLQPAATDSRDTFDAPDAPFDHSCDAWLSTIALLNPQAPAPTTYTADDHAHRAHAPIVTVIERPSSAMAVVSWRDATHCRYGEQIWTIGIARQAGTCALTGQPIGKMAAVYQPQRSRTPALNADAMILASAMENTCGVTEPAREPEAEPAIRYRSR
ncbi:MULTISPECIES: DUF3331 domain-containing protein [unclassified Cupriavidus]|uniref:DUF3331 domain-containing protein n=1 Tax=unclassified Cupriavidus TaxID=2640874 RepID=UPI0010F5CEFC|nr:MULTISPECIES: DUF3331 domain-containing protein [unclassified Cupriavidus]MWL89212.1 DUF3331 domain-containing protein [Cupriavidus sp. SW-Y-13]